jgi:hypothetical protein
MRSSVISPTAIHVSIVQVFVTENAGIHAIPLLIHCSFDSKMRREWGRRAVQVTSAKGRAYELAQMCAYNRRLRRVPFFLRFLP